MLSSAKIGTGSWRYYTAGVACRASEYYLGVGEAPGRWHGRGLEPLELSPGSVVTERELEAMFARGLHPSTGSRLGRAWRSDGVTGFDLTFSAPKSISALWALGDSTTAAQAMAAHRAAVRAGLAYLDTHASLSRRGTDGVEQIGSTGLVAAVFDHRSSRAADPQLHTHALVLNKVRCSDGRWRTLDATELFHHKKSAGMVYQAALRNEMQQRLGVRFREVNENGQADIVGVPDELLTLWSKRTATIDAGSELPRWAYRRRGTLTDLLITGEQWLRQTDPTWATLEAEIDRLTRQVAHHTRQRQVSDLAAQRTVRTDTADPTLRGCPRGGPGQHRSTPTGWRAC